MADMEAPIPLEGGEKHDIASYVSQNKTLSTEASEERRPVLDENRAPRMVRSAEHLNIAQKTQVEGHKATSNVRVEHIVKIFTGDEDDFIEGTRLTAVSHVPAFA